MVHCGDRECRIPGSTDAHANRPACNSDRVRGEIGVQIDHHVLRTALQAAMRGEVECCAWNRLARFANDGSLRPEILNPRSTLHVARRPVEVRSSDRERWQERSSAWSVDRMSMNMSVDIDWTYLPIKGSDESLAHIDAALCGLGSAIEAALPGTKTMNLERAGKSMTKFRVLRGA